MESQESCSNLFDDYQPEETTVPDKSEFEDKCPTWFLASPVLPFHPFLGEASPTEIDYRKKGILILTSLLEDLGSFYFDSASTQVLCEVATNWRVWVSCL